MAFDISYHDDQTMQKVYKALEETGISARQALDAVMKMQNAGILFREKSTDKTFTFGGSQETGHVREELPSPDSPFTSEAMQRFYEREQIDSIVDPGNEREEPQNDPSLD